MPSALDGLRKELPELTIRGAADATNLLGQREAQLRERLEQHSEMEPAPIERREDQRDSDDLDAMPQPVASTSKLPTATTFNLSALRTSRPPRNWLLGEYGIPEPVEEGEPDPAVAAKLEHFRALRAQGIRFNATLQANKSFRNPSSLSNVVHHADLDEKLSAFPLEVWESSSGMGADAWASAISQKQKLRYEEREKAQERGKRSKIDFSPSKPSTERDQYDGRTSSRRPPLPSNSSSRNDSLRKEESRWDGLDGQRHGSVGRHRERDRRPERDRTRDRSRSPRRR